VDKIKLHMLRNQLTVILSGMELALEAAKKVSRILDSCQPEPEQEQKTDAA
jgi:hypothetical protein